ncbi:UDP-N-acetylmuramoylalanine--D-glutamate ligase [Rubrivivax sp. A210]|uniref:UDP-N-acetylmuramoyl-L-alanine--D-glutamate ligase n=1 Tax=Rubrivivax sp. A210 TaxID=2772301 RepID=UPI00191982BF|nr:UDP-N-acetylmuramoyl-L-alanine--D-glutamate ligase [Rubrivivax sp. A210]CAD5370527.1 UDP-N-acetylmuramoylalanine--D-glutamate ligase [Rubrivivax sp. A210]
MDHLRDLPVLILGLGDSGLAMARWCLRHGAKVRVWDSREAPPQAETLRAELPGAALESGVLDATRLGDTRLLLKSPGLGPYDERIAPLLQEARASAIAVQGELDLFARALADLKAAHGYAPQVLAITGTNGKTTTTAMTALLVERAGRRVAMAGNIGPTLLDTLAVRLEAEQQAWPEVWVLELSSFQLDGGGTGVKGFEPAAGTVLNVTQDHLDWHGSMAAYAAAKARVFGSAGLRVINRDDALVEAMVPVPPPVKGKAKSVERATIRFGLDAPRRPGDFGLVTENGIAWMVRALPTDETIKRKKDEEVEIHLQRLMPADALRVRGRHNAANALAALALATAIGCPLAPMLHGLREYEGEPHRVQFVAVLDGVEAYDDSKGTNVGATVAALDGLGADKSPARLVVILGGDGKGQDFGPLAAPLARHARAVATIGRDAAAIEAVIQQGAAAIPFQRHDSLEVAVAWCFAQARPGDAVLLSPACASLDMFRNYAHRAEVFVQAVQALALDRGQA